MKRIPIDLIEEIKGHKEEEQSRLLAGRTHSVSNKTMKKKL